MSAKSSISRRSWEECSIQWKANTRKRKTMDPGNRIQHHAGRSPSDARLGASQSRLDRERGGLQDECLQGRNGLDRWPDRVE